MYNFRWEGGGLSDISVNFKVDSVMHDNNNFDWTLHVLVSDKIIKKKHKKYGYTDNIA